MDLTVLLSYPTHKQIIDLSIQHQPLHKCKNLFFPISIDKGLATSSAKCDSFKLNPCITCQNEPQQYTQLLVIVQSLDFYKAVLILDHTFGVLISLLQKMHMCNSLVQGKFTLFSIEILLSKQKKFFLLVVTQGQA
jgi:hypothetical protein